MTLEHLKKLVDEALAKGTHPLTPVGTRTFSHKSDLVSADLDMQGSHLFRLEFGNDASN